MGSQILIRNIDPGAIERLRARARRNHRSLEAEARALIEQAPADDPLERRREAQASVERVRAMLASIPQTSDSVDLVREDRDR